MTYSLRASHLQHIFRTALILGVGAGLLNGLSACREDCPLGLEGCACADASGGGNACLFNLECQGGVCVAGSGTATSTSSNQATTTSGSTTNAATTTSGAADVVSDTSPADGAATDVTADMITGMSAGGASSGGPGAPGAAGATMGTVAGAGGQTTMEAAVDASGGSTTGGAAGDMMVSDQSGTGGVPTAQGGSPAEDIPNNGNDTNACDGIDNDNCDPGCSPASNGGSVYMLCNPTAAKSWDAAAAHCAANDMRLAKLDDFAEYQWLGSIVCPDCSDQWSGDLGARVWVGLKNQGDDTFMWEDGSAPGDELVWAAGEPSFSFEGSPEHCVHYWNYPPDNFDVINDSDCNESLSYACERY